MSLAAKESNVAARDLVAGDLIQFNDNGTWSWYQDERAVVDPAAGRLILGSAASERGVGGPQREGHIEAVVFDLETRRGKRSFFHRSDYADDHDAPAFLVLPDGRYLSFYARHYDHIGRFRIFDRDSWSEERNIDWRAMAEGFEFLTYANLFYLSAEERVYNISRAQRRNPNVIASDDLGETWTHLGLLTAPPGGTRGYVNGYFKYWSNGVDRIDFIATEAHPRNYNTSMYHGYIKDGQTWNTFGEPIGRIHGMDAPPPEAFTPIFRANTVVNGLHLSRLWNLDLHVHGDGTIAALMKARVDDDPDRPSNDPDHLFLYSRFAGGEWKTSLLGRAGTKLYDSEQDYTGLGALHPNDPATIYISTPIDPRDEVLLGVHEIFRGNTTDDGVTWSWTPVTRNSTRDNLRPIVPFWEEGATALLWWRGSYETAQRYDAAVVGLIERNGETRERMVFVKAADSNTTRADGRPLAASGPAAARGEADDRWHWRAGFGQEGVVLASSEYGGEDAPMLKTTLSPGEAGVYDLWINFWGNPEEDWRIRAGLAAEDLQIYRTMASQQVERGMHTGELELRGDGNTSLYRAYLGRVRIQEGDTIEVFVDDHSIETGTRENRIGGTARTWYDGISFARVRRPAGD